MFSLVLAWLVCGMVASVAGFAQLWYPTLAALLLLPLLALAGAWQRVQAHWPHFTQPEKLIVFGLWLVWLLHLVGVFVPETGFDAVWYHLPVMQAFTPQHGFAYLPELYQSLNPLFSDAIIGLGFLVGGELGAKAVAYLFAISTAVLSFRLARHLLPRKWSLLAVLLVSLIQVMTWQASSFYVDVAKAFWELAALLALLEIPKVTVHRRSWLVVLVGATIGASLATKAFSLLLVPTIIVMLFFSLTGTHILQRLKLVGLVLLAMLVIAWPFYLRNYTNTGSWSFTLSHNITQMDKLGGQATVSAQLFERITNLPFAPLFLLKARDYISPVLFAGLPLFVLYVNRWRQQRKFLLLSLWSATQLAVWWFLPPLSTRYALSGFIVLLLLSVWALQQAAHYNHTTKKIVTAIIILSLLWGVAPRLFVLKRQLKFVTGQQSKQQYLQQFLDGNIDQPLRTWHQF